MAVTCPAAALRAHLSSASAKVKSDADIYYALAKQHIGAGPSSPRRRRRVHGALGATGLCVAGVIGGALAARGALWLARGTVDNVSAVASGFGELHKRLFGTKTTCDIRSAMESISSALVQSEEEEQDDKDKVDALSGPPVDGVGAGDGVPDAHAGGGERGGGDGDVAEPCAQPDEDGAAGGGDGGAPPDRAAAARRRTPRKIVVEFSVGNRKYQLDGFWARLAFDAKERFRSIEYSDYSKAAVSRWLDMQLRAAGNVRYVDRRRNLGIIELYVWYVDDAEKDLTDAFSELKAMGRIRTRTE